MVRPTDVLHMYHEEDDEEMCEINQIIEIIRQGTMLVGNVEKWVILLENVHSDMQIFRIGMQEKYNIPIQVLPQ